jgi:hypothetical protein
MMKYVAATSYPTCYGKQYGNLVNGRLIYTGECFTELFAVNLRGETGASIGVGDNPFTRNGYFTFKVHSSFLTILFY